MGISSNLQGLMDAQSPGTQSRGALFFSEFPSVWFLGNCEQTPKGEVRFFLKF